GEQPATDTIAGAGTSVRVWRAPVDGVARFSVVIDGAATVTAATVAGRTGRVVLTVPGDILAENIMASGGLIAGDPDGARVVINADGVVAFDGSGTETAQITGEGGEFVGGEFRTSDGLPGRVRIADDAFTYSGLALPGIEIIPEDTRYTVRPAGIGPWGAGAALAGGEDSSGRSAKLHAIPTQAGITSTSPKGDAKIYASSSGASMRATRSSDGDSGHVSVDYTGANLTATDGESGEYGRILASPRELRMSLLDGSGNATGGVRVIAGTASVSSAAPDGREAEVAVGLRTGARVGYTSADGVTRSLSVDSRGVWVKTNKGGSSMNYNLEETAQDSGWQAFSPVAGMDSYALAWRNKGGVIYMRGTVTATWSAGWNTVATGLPAEMRPAIRVVRQAPSTSEQGLYF